MTKIKRNVVLAAVLCLATVGALFLLLSRGSNELINVSNVVPTPCDGVSLLVSATARDMTYTIRSETVDYIVYDGFQNSMHLEMLQDGQWHVVSRTKLCLDMSEPISPGYDCTRTIRWKDYYDYPLSAGEYRLVLTFWAMQQYVQSENYNAIAVFTID